MRVRRRRGRSVQVELLTRPGCHLCDAARPVLAEVCADLGVDWAERDISGDPAAMAEYGDQIPVVLIGGRVHDFWRVDPVRLRRALR